MLIKEIKEFLENINNDFNLTNGTKTYYYKHSIIINRWLLENDIKSLSNLTYFNVANFISESSETLSAVTVNRRVGIFKMLVKDNKYIDPFEKEKILAISKLKEIKRNYNILRDKQLREIIYYVKSLPNKNNNLMYKVLILLLIDTGARIKEILNIKKSNIDLKNQEILLETTKTDIDRYVYFHTDTKEYLKELISLKDNKSQFILFNIDKNRQINYDDVRYIMKKIKFDLNYNKLNSYMFRHTFGTRLVENGADLFSVKKIMGHEKITTTQIYIHTSNKHTKKVYLKSHIR